VVDFLYDIYRVNQLGEDTHTYVDTDDDVIGVFFVDEADDAPNQTSDQDVADRAAAAQVPSFASAPNLANTTVAANSNRAVFDADDLTFTALTGDQVESVDIFKDTGTDTTSVLMLNMDTATGLPLTPSGGDVVIVWNPSGIWRL